MKIPLCFGKTYGLFFFRNHFANLNFLDAGNILNFIFFGFFLRPKIMGFFFPPF